MAMPRQAVLLVWRRKTLNIFFLVVSLLSWAGVVFDRGSMSARTRIILTSYMPTYRVVWLSFVGYFGLPLLLILGLFGLVGINLLLNICFLTVLLIVC